MTTKSIKAAFAAVAVGLALTFGLSTGAEAGGSRNHGDSAYSGYTQNHRPVYKKGNQHRNRQIRQRRNKQIRQLHRRQALQRSRHRPPVYGGRNQRRHRNNDALIIGGAIIGGAILYDVLTRPHYPPQPRVIYVQPPAPAPVPQATYIAGNRVVSYTQESVTGYARPVVQGLDGQLCVAVQTEFGTQFYDVTTNLRNIDYGGGPKPSNSCRSGPG